MDAFVDGVAANSRTTTTLAVTDGPARSVPATRAQRVESVDALRGVVMIIMALDHVRDYFGGTAISPTNLATTTVPLFFTRWITHLCRVQLAASRAPGAKSLPIWRTAER